VLEGKGGRGPELGIPLVVIELVLFVGVVDKRRKSVLTFSCSCVIGQSLLPRTMTDCSFTLFGHQLEAAKLAIIKGIPTWLVFSSP